MNMQIDVCCISQRGPRTSTRREETNSSVAVSCLPKIIEIERGLSKLVSMYSRVTFMRHRVRRQAWHLLCVCMCVSGSLGERDVELDVAKKCACGGRSRDHETRHRRVVVTSNDRRSRQTSGQLLHPTSCYAPPP